MPALLSLGNRPARGGFPRKTTTNRCLTFLTPINLQPGDAAMRTRWTVAVLIAAFAALSAHRLPAADDAPAGRQTSFALRAGRYAGLRPLNRATERRAAALRSRAPKVLFPRFVKPSCTPSSSLLRQYWRTGGRHLPRRPCGEAPPFYPLMKTLHMAIQGRRGNPVNAPLRRQRLAT